MVVSVLLFKIFISTLAFALKNESSLKVYPKLPLLWEVGGEKKMLDSVKNLLLK